ncbi:MAG: sigma-70 family RNA polymerase sigma factor [Sphingobacteriia bacterium]|nr:sigma-70 family RNA polymerase sigma factor [Sphingobacteriia bacterium]
MALKKQDIEIWVEEYAGILLSYTLARTENNATAEDLVQETFISAWKNRDEFKETASVKTWLFTICKNKIIDYYRKKARSPIQFAEAGSSDLFFDDKEHWQKEEGPKNWPNRFTMPTEQKEFNHIIGYCKKKLQEMQQRVFVLKYLEDLETEEICKLLNISTSNYWVLIHRAKLQIRACLEKNWIKL